MKGGCAEGSGCGASTFSAVGSSALATGAYGCDGGVGGEYVVCVKCGCGRGAYMYN